MENSYKALIMGASVLLFVIAVSIAIYTYSVLMDTTDQILTTSETFAKSAEYFSSNTDDTTRRISAAEVVGNILNLGENLDYKYKEIKVEGIPGVFTADNVKTRNTYIAQIINGSREYFISDEDLNDLTITYKYIS